MVVTSFLPSRVIAYVGSENEREGCFYAFWKDGQMLVIQTKPFVPSNYPDLLDNKSEAERSISMFNLGLEKITTLLDVMDFGRSHWAYFIERHDGSYRLEYRATPMYSISCQLWAPLVDESEITITRWMSCEDRLGKWKGRDVDLLIGWNDRWLRMVESETKGHRQLRGLDLTLEVLGHVVRDGHVVGLMTEPATGRLVQYHDRALVYNAVSKLQSRGLYCYIHPSSIMIVNGRVRLLRLSSVRPMESAAKGPGSPECLWSQVEFLFDDLSHSANVLPSLRNCSLKIHILAPTPSPSRPLYSVDSKLYRIVVQRASPVEEPHTARRTDAQSLRRHDRRRSVAPLVLANHRASSTSDSEYDRSDVPENHSVWLPRRLLSSRVHSQSGYASGEARHRGVLLSPDDSDLTSESGCSSF
ncbi:hypothetical protein HGRIS_006871 [Hohenbuehelia grisea]|uniref:Uncharacterized protein n=1 Tax=Hohenbuehelia grisea TaxID=104357 RepID=A0ABR3JAA1_9AGAR